jgi:hypothetical protein
VKIKLTFELFSYWLICFYGFLIPLGSIVKFGSEEGALGASTIVLVLVLTASIKVGVSSMFRNETFLFLLLLILWMIFASFFSYDPYVTVKNSLSLILYLLAAAVAYNILKSEARVFWLLFSFCLGGLISGSLTIIDFFGYYDIPGVNEEAIGTRTELGSILQATGPFARRSSLSVYFTMIITVGILFAVLQTGYSNSVRFYFFYSAIICLFALLLTHNRSGMITSFVVPFLVLFFISKSIFTKIKYILFAVFFAIVALQILHTFFPDVWYAYQALLQIGNVASTDVHLADSDQVRFELFLYSITSIFSNPFGFGYGLMFGIVEFENGIVDPHNIVTQVIWGAGLVGAILLMLIGWRIMGILRKLYIRRVEVIGSGGAIIIVFGGLISFFSIGMMHTVISTGIAWIFLGLFLSLAKKHC